MRHGVGIWQSTFHGESRQKMGQVSRAVGPSEDLVDRYDPHQDIAHIFQQGRRVRYMPNDLREAGALRDGLGSMPESGPRIFSGRTAHPTEP